MNEYFKGNMNDKRFSGEKAIAICGDFCWQWKRGGGQQ